MENVMATNNKLDNDTNSEKYSWNFIEAWLEVYYMQVDPIHYLQLVMC